MKKYVLLFMLTYPTNNYAEDAASQSEQVTIQSSNSIELQSAEIPQKALLETTQLPEQTLQINPIIVVPEPPHVVCSSQTPEPPRKEVAKPKLDPMHTLIIENLTNHVVHVVEAGYYKDIGPHEGITLYWEKPLPEGDPAILKFYYGSTQDTALKNKRYKNGAEIGTLKTNTPGTIQLRYNKKGTLLFKRKNELPSPS